ncbi:MAG: hypothetical protein GY804_04205 [Alphaproteobacteria bacterium]|nr:hypothetical protein [Alphaproteobacteria bacterium]
MIILYLFYMRGLYIFKAHNKNIQEPNSNKLEKQKTASNSDELEKQDTQANINEPEKREMQANINELAFNRLRRERTFEEFILLLKSQSFLEILLHYLMINGFEDTKKIWELEEEEQIKEKLSKVAEIIIGLDPTSGLILDGVGSYRLFIQIICLSLCCLWRKDEADEVIQTETKIKYHKFYTFCDDRFKIRNKEKENPAKKLKNAIAHIIKQNYKNEIADITANRDRSEIGATWQKRITNLKEWLDRSEKKVQLFEGQKNDLNLQVGKLETEIKDSEAKIAGLEDQKNDLNLQVNKLETEKKDSEAKIAGLEDQKNDLNLQVDKLNTEMNDLKTSLENEKKNLNAKLDSFHTENSLLQADIEKLTNEKNTLTNDNDASKTKLFNLEKELNKLREDIKHKQYLLKDSADQFSTTLSGAYKKYSVEQFVGEVFSFFDYISNKI